MPYELLSTGNVLISSDTRSGLSEEIDKFVMEHDPDTMNIRTRLKGLEFRTYPSGGGDRDHDARIQVSDVPMYKGKTWSEIFEYTENAEKLKKEKLEAKRLKDAKIAEEKALKKEKRDARIKAKKDAEIAKLEKKLARMKKK